MKALASYIVYSDVVFVIRAVYRRFEIFTSILSNIVLWSVYFKRQKSLVPFFRSSLVVSTACVKRY